MLLGQLMHGMISVRHLFVQSFVDNRLGPVIVVRILDHLEVGDSDTAGVAEEIRQDVDVFGLEDVVSFRCGRPIGQFGDDFGFDVGGIPAGDHTFQGGWNQHIHIQLQQFFVRDIVSAGEVDD